MVRTVKQTFTCLLTLLFLLPLGLCAQKAVMSAPREGIGFNAASKMVVKSLKGSSTQFRTTLPASAFAKARKTQGLRTANAAGNQSIELWGNIVATDSWDYGSGSDVGYYSFTTDEGSELSELALAESLFFNGGGIVYDGKAHGIYYMESQGATYAYYIEYDTSSWEQSVRTGESITDPTMIATSLAYDPVDKKVYGQFYNASQTGFEFSTIDYDALTRATTISTTQTQWLAMAANSKGELFAIDDEGNLLQVNKTSGTTTKVGSTGVTPYPCLQSATCDPRTDEIYWASVDVSGYCILYKVDAETGKATKVCDMPDGAEAVGLYIPYYYLDGAPQSVSSITLDYPNESTTGTVSFKVPSRTNGGDALTGSVTYEIIANGEVVKTGTAAPGESVSAEVTLPGGETTVGVRLSNEVGESAVPEVVQWIGPDVPVAASNVTLSIDKANNNLATLTWTAPTTGTHEGELDASKLTYNVVRYPGEVAVATGISATSFSENLPTPEYLTSYYYTVQVANNGVTGEVATSNKVALGDVATVPYYEDFNSKGSADVYTIVDANEDGASWFWSSYSQSMRYERSWNYDTPPEADDWLITPAIYLQANCVYTFSFYVSNGSASTERYAAGFGRSTDPSAFTQLVEATDLASGDSKKVSVDVTTTEAGKYYFGIQACSGSDGYFFTADNVSVTLKTNNNTPAAPSLTVTPDANGEQQATLSITVPTQTIGGATLSNVTKVEVVRGEEVIQTFDNPAPGSTLSYVDTTPENGDNTYIVYACNEAGEGAHAVKTVYVGVDIPLSPTNILLKDNLDGTGTLSWQSPGSVGEQGNPVVESKLIYNVYSVNAYGQPSLLAGNLTSMSYQVTIPQTGSQDLVYFAVTAQNAADESLPGVSSVVLKGKAFTLPFKESFPNGKLEKSPWTADRDGESYFDPVKNTSADSDGGAASFTAAAEGDAATLGSGKISLAGSTAPWLVFRYYANPTKIAKLDVELQRNGDPENVVTLKTINYSTLTGEAGWRFVAIDLSAYKADTYDRILFTATSEDTSVPVTIDDINVRDAQQYDLAASISAPTRVDFGSDLKVSVEVQNIGLQQASGYTVRLFANNKEVASQQGTALESNSLTTYNFACPTANVSGESMKVYAYVDYSADQSTSNNTTKEVEVAVVRPDLPIVSDLAAESGNGGVRLTWTKPATDPEKITDGFESYDAFLIDSFGDWVGYNLDGQHCGGWNSLSFNHARESYGFMVFDAEEAGADLTSYPNMAARNGSKIAASMAPYEGYNYSDWTLIPTEPGDHWLVSPLLNGKAQTVSFYVKTYSYYYQENTSYYGLEPFEIWYSTTDTDPANFTQLGETAEAPLEWTQAQANLPAGTRYFAIRHTPGINEGESGWVFMVDDVTYQTGDFQVAKYNIYRDGELIGSTTQTVYDDYGTQEGENHTYTVTVVYVVGESSNSNEVSVLSTAIEEGASSAAPAVEVQRQALTISNANGQSVQVFGADGKLVHAETAVSNRLTVPVQTGVYAVKVGGKVVKVTVR